MPKNCAGCDDGCGDSGISPYDPEQTMFEAAAELERKGYTKEEIFEALTDLFSEYGKELHQDRQ